MKSSPSGVGDWRPLHVRRALSGGSVGHIRLGKGLECLPTQPWLTLFSTSAQATGLMWSSTLQLWSTTNFNFNFNMEEGGGENHKLRGSTVSNYGLVYLDFFSATETTDDIL